MIGNMGDVATLTDRLATMPDNMLPRLAQQYKTDAVTLSLILSEKNRRDRVRQSFQAQAGAQPQPKVNDQIVANMQQPSPGIAGLPAPTMQGMADGGIAGYAEGGEVERYQVGGTTPRGPYGSVLAGTEFDIPGLSVGEPRTYAPRQAGDTEGLPLFQRLLAQGRETGMRYQIEQARARIAAGYGTEADYRLLKEATGPAATDPQEMAQFDAATERFMADRASKKEAPKTETKKETGKTAPKADTGRRDAAPAAKPPVTDPFSIESLRAEQEAAMRPLQLQQGELRNQMVGLRSQMEGQAEGALSRRRKEIEEEGDLYAGRMERIKAREADLLKQKDTNMGLALLNAGLAIMSTPGSLGTAIGKGARVGTEQYAAGLDKLRAAQERLEEAKDRTEELRMNRSDMNKREIRQMERDRDAAYLAGSKLFYDFTNSVYNMDRQDTNALLASAAKGREMKFEQAGRERVAQIQIAPQLERNALISKGQNEAEKVRAEYGKLQKNVMDALAKDATYQMAKPAEKAVMENDALRRALMNNPFLSGYAANIGFSSTPTGPVYDLTEE